jgi:hypothetical protein
MQGLHLKNYFNSDSYKFKSHFMKLQKNFKTTN